MTLLIIPRINCIYKENNFLFAVNNNQLLKDEKHKCY